MEERGSRPEVGLEVFPGGEPPHNTAGGGVVLSLLGKEHRLTGAGKRYRDREAGQETWAEQGSNPRPPRCKRGARTS